ncbi:hypothetical protein [Xanthovirga aplysinae]|uniref:hypothetical protein n=1 Tax=Xanthovirga aplysinae TaxID=2529853 RepID=UPI0012BB6574|nr:hypothetical protein [Xanthovirga aplysinae]MTI30744.1 hypothetical protein [Xanthovirga aplysinae]
MKQKSESQLFNEKIEFLENQLHALNKKINTPKKIEWWKKNIPLTICLIALVSSLIFNVAILRKSHFKKGSDFKAEKIKEVENLTLAILDVFEAGEYLLPKPSMDILGTYNNYRREIYVKKIIRAMAQIDHKFSTNIYGIVGKQLESEGQFAEAIKYFGLARENARNPISRALAFRELGNIYGLFDTKIYNYDSSNYYWKQSLITSDSIIGDKKYYFKGYAYFLRGQRSYLQGYHDNAIALMDSAIIEFEKMSDYNPWKWESLDRVDGFLEITE